MYLHVLKTCEEADVEVTLHDVDGCAIFWPHYYAGMADDDHDLIPYNPPPAFAEAHAFWRQFCAHQFLAFALEEFLAAVLDALSPHPEGLTKSELLDKLASNEAVQDLEKVTKTKCSTPSALLKAVGIKEVPVRICWFSQQVSTPQGKDAHECRPSPRFRHWSKSLHFSSRIGGPAQNAAQIGF
jgi:hypothetical protein